MASACGKLFHADCVEVRQSKTKRMAVVGVTFVRYGVKYIATHQYPKGHTGKDAIQMALRNACRKVEIFRGDLQPKWA